MPNPENKPAKKPGVSSLWRTATVCMIAGLAVHWWIADRPNEPKDQELTVRDDPLPPEIYYDSRFDHALDAVDLDNVLLPVVPHLLCGLARRRHMLQTCFFKPIVWRKIMNANSV
jgi:hypothetical protein